MARSYFTGAYPPQLQGAFQVSSDSVNTTVQYEPDALALVKAHIEDFGRAVQGDGEPAASGVDGLMAVQVTEAMVESLPIHDESLSY